MSHQISVMVHTPAHSGIGGALTYESDTAHAPGTLVRVPLGSRELLGVVWDEAAPLAEKWRYRTNSSSNPNGKRTAILVDGR